MHANASIFATKASPSDSLCVQRPVDVEFRPSLRLVVLPVLPGLEALIDGFDCRHFPVVDGQEGGAEGVDRVGGQSRLGEGAEGREDGNLSTWRFRFYSLVLNRASTLPGGLVNLGAVM